MSGWLRVILHAGALFAVIGLAVGKEDESRFDGGVPFT